MTTSVDTDVPECFKQKEIVYSYNTIKVSKCNFCDYAWNCENAFKDQNTTICTATST